MARIDEAIIEKIKNEVDIVDVIKHYIPVSKKGRNYVAICPFHADSNPSLSISTDKQIYKCFVCQAGGNAFTFVQNHQHVHFVEAVKTVADIGNLSIPELNDFVVLDVIDDKNAKYYKLNEDISKFYEYYVKTQSGLNAFNYLADRGIDLEAIEYFKIGYAPDKNKIIDFFKKINDEDSLEKIDALYSRDDGQVYPRFTSRVMFPIQDEHQRIVGFSGRAIEQEYFGGKYVNSAETIIFKKSQVLYNLNRCIMDIKKEGYVYLVEGFMDVIAFYKAGVKNVVATMGTALTSEHIKKISRYTKKVVVAYDGDRAGALSMIKAANLIHQSDLKVQVVSFPDGLDPDDFVKEKGADQFKVLLNNKLNPIQFVMDYYFSTLNLSNHEDVKEYIKIVVEQIETHGDDIDRDRYVRDLSKRTGISEHVIEHQIEMPAHNDEMYFRDEYFEKPPQVIHLTKFERAELQLIYFMINYRQASILYVKNLGFMYSALNIAIAEHIVSYYQTHQVIDQSLFINELQSDDLKNVYTSIISLSLEKVYNEKAVIELIETIKKNAVKLKLDDLYRDLSVETNNLEKAKIGAEIVSLKLKLKE